MVSAKIYVALASFSGFANAHMFLASPTRFTTPAVTNGPLLADGSNYPCQYTGSGGYAGPTNTFALGSTQELSFEGVAVHGGGSCQVSLTTDEEPTSSSIFRVIHSIQGGCPAQNQAGNLAGDDATSPDPYMYNFTIPSDIPSGKYTLAWSWMNRIGNREFYMNCAAVSLTGTGGSSSNFEALPEITTANIGNGCTTTENFDYMYYEPGNSVVNLNMTELIYPVGSSCLGASGSSSGSGSGSGSGGGSGSSSSSTAATSSAAYGGGGGGGASSPPFITQSAGLSSSTTVTATTASVAGVGGGASESAAAPSATGASSGSSSSGTTSSGSGSGNSNSTTTNGNIQTAGTACSPEGEWNCISGTSYQQCASGVWSVVMQMAAGTECQSGMSTVMDVKAVASGNKIKRQSLWRRRSHIARHAHR